MVIEHTNIIHIQYIPLGSKSFQGLSVSSMLKINKIYKKPILSPFHFLLIVDPKTFFPFLSPYTSFLQKKKKTSFLTNVIFLDFTSLRVSLLATQALALFWWLSLFANKYLGITLRKLFTFSRIKCVFWVSYVPWFKAFS